MKPTKEEILLKHSQTLTRHRTLPHSSGAGFFYFNTMDLLTLLKMMDEYLQKTENKTLEEKLNESKNK